MTRPDAAPGRRVSREIPDDVLLARLVAAAQRWSPGAGLDDLRRVSGGASSITYRARLTRDGKSGTCFVKVAPAGLEPVRNRDVLRQAAVQRLLWASGTVPVPPILFTDAGDPPDTPPLVVSVAVPGESVEPLVDKDAQLPPPEVLGARTLAAVRTLARLHEVDVDTVAALPGQGKPSVDLAGEVDRWARVFATVDAELAAAGETCAARLRERLPAPLAPALVHGDFRLGNLICVDDEVRAVLDWEIWSVSDPRVDLGWFLMTLEPDGLPSAVRRSAPGLPGPDAALAEYERLREIDLADLEWFASLSRFRAAAAMSLNVKHNRRRSSPDPGIERYASKLPRFLEVATAFLGSTTIPAPGSPNLIRPR